MAREAGQLVTFSDLQWAVSNNNFTAIYAFTENTEAYADKAAIEARINVDTMAGAADRLPSWDELVASLPSSISIQVSIQFDSYVTITMYDDIGQPYSLPIDVMVEVYFDVLDTINSTYRYPMEQFPILAGNTEQDCYPTLSPDELIDNSYTGLADPNNYNGVPIN